jgi:hypothetical protein
LIADSLRDFLQLLAQSVEAENNTPISVFFDVSEIQLGERWQRAHDQTLSQSKMLLAAFSPRYFASDWCLSELKTFLTRSRMTGTNLIVPILLPGTEITADAIYRSKYYNFTPFGQLDIRRTDNTQFVEFYGRVQAFSHNLVELLRRVPAFNQDWSIIYPELGGTLPTTIDYSWTQLSTVVAESEEILDDALAALISQTGKDALGGLYALDRDDVWHNNRVVTGSLRNLQNMKLIEKKTKGPILTLDAEFTLVDEFNITERGRSVYERIKESKSS